MKAIPWMLAVMLVVNASAFWGDAPKNDTNEQLARLFGKNTAFTATALVSVKGRLGRENQSAEMNYAFLDGKLRGELDMAKTKTGAKHAEQMEMVAGMGLGQMITLVRPDKKASYVVYPGLKAYCEFPQTISASQKEGKQPKLERTDLGPDTIDGHPCTKQKIVTTDEEGKKYEMNVWFATDLNDFPIRSELQSGGDTVVTTFRDIKLDKPDAALFELPTGFKRYDNVQQMMMESVQRMMGGQ